MEEDGHADDGAHDADLDLAGREHQPADGVGGDDVLLIGLPFLAVGALLGLACARTLNALALGDDLARGRRRCPPARAGTTRSSCGR